MSYSCQNTIILHILLKERKGIIIINHYSIIGQFISSFFLKKLFSISSILFNPIHYSYNMDIFFFASTTEGGGCNDTIVHYELLMNQQKKPSLLNHLFFFYFWISKSHLYSYQIKYIYGIIISIY